MNDSLRAPAPIGAAAAFDAVTWHKQLLALNPWTRGLTIGEGDEAFAAAQQKATLDRHAEGKEAWNTWANGMLALKKTIQETGRWAAEAHREQNDDTRLWIILAAGVFSTDRSRHTFEGEASFEELVFPDAARFDGATFVDEVDFDRATFTAAARFQSATFSAHASFQETIFHASARFEGANFADDAQFEAASFAAARFQRAAFGAEADFGRATFTGAAQFRKATFAATAWFDRASFAAVAEFQEATFRAVRFERATFGAAARFPYATFSADTRFEGATFSGGTYLNDVRFDGPVNLSQARFQAAVVLDRSVFKQSASFEAIDSQAAFSLAEAAFHQVPSFIGANFRGALRLDNVATPKYRRLGWTPDNDASAHFRELKRRAVEAHDHDRELEFFAQEIRTARFHSGAHIFGGWRTVMSEEGRRRKFVWLRLPTRMPRFWSWRFWFGIAYGAFSNFGRSLLRPALAWLALLLGFAVFYLGQHEHTRNARVALHSEGVWSTLAAYAETTRAAWAAPPACQPATNRLFASTDVVKEALNLSASNALVVFNVGRGDVSRRTYGCLYGFEHGDPQAPPIVPYSVAAASTLQTLLSAILIFLFLLAVRNLLRLK
jgi:hypothetical protein